MPGKKFHSLRRKKKRPPLRRKRPQSLQESPTLGVIASNTTVGIGVSTTNPAITPPLFSSPSPSPDQFPSPQSPQPPPPSTNVTTSPTTVPETPPQSKEHVAEPPTAAEKKLNLSPLCTPDSTYKSNVYEGRGLRVYELPAFQEALLQATRCIKCKRGRVVLKENLKKRQGLFTAPFLFCRKCKNNTPIFFTKAGKQKRGIAINQRAILASKCAGQTYAGLKMLFAMLDLPVPVSKNAYTLHVREVREKALMLAEKSMARARDEARNLLMSVGDDVVDIIISADGTWQKRGYKSLLGAVFIISNETGKVIAVTL